MNQEPDIPIKEAEETKDRRTPSEPGPNDTVIMFVDIAGASEVSNHMSVEKYYKKFLKKFSQLFIQTCKEFYKNIPKSIIVDEETKWSARGDEGILFFFPVYKGEWSDQEYYESKNRGLATCVDTAIHIGLALKRKWLLSEENSARIAQGIMPIDLGVGIHVGKTWITIENGEYQPEGYAINLGKRVESHSRNGRYSRIFVSEAAHAVLEYLADERTYTFDEATSVDAKGFSREVRAFEVQHHFLPTDWTDYVLSLVDTTQPSDGIEQDQRDKRTRLANLYTPVPTQNVTEDVQFSTDKEFDRYLSLTKEARAINPTNIWLSEELIKADMVSDLYHLAKINGKVRDRSDIEKDLETKSEMGTKYQTAFEVASYLSQSDLRDAGVLMIQGLIEGERLDFDGEQRRYRRAQNFSDQIARLAWYRGYSCAQQAYNIFDWEKVNKETRDITNNFDSRQLDYCIKFVRDDIELIADKEALKINLCEWIKNARDFLTSSVELSPFSAWPKQALGIELIMWTSDQTAEGMEEIEYGKELIKAACEILPDVKLFLTEHKYIEKISDEEWVQDILSNE